MARTKRIINKPEIPEQELLKSAHAIHCDGIDSVNSLAKLYSRATRRRGPGAPTHEEQDLLRAMVVMASAALDATLKRIIRDTLSELARRNKLVLDEVQKLIKRRLLSDLEKRGGDRLAEALLYDSPRQRVIEFIIEDATGDSLQSEAEVQKVVQLLGIENFKTSNLRKAFIARNQVVHEMDSTLGPGFRRRRRTKGEMVGYAKALLETATQILEKVDTSFRQ